MYGDFVARMYRRERVVRSPSSCRGRNYAACRRERADTDFTPLPPSRETRPSGDPLAGANRARPRDPRNGTREGFSAGAWLNEGRIPWNKRRLTSARSSYATNPASSLPVGVRSGPVSLRRAGPPFISSFHRRLRESRAAVARVESRDRRCHVSNDASFQQPRSPILVRVARLRSARRY